MCGPLATLFVLVLIAAIAGGVWMWTKHHYVKSIEERGWTWVESPDISITIGLNCAPFGVGFSRKVDAQVFGRGPPDHLSRQLEYFLRTGGLGFSIEAGGAIRVEGGSWSPAELDRTSEFLHGFFSRVPDFTWKELGAWPRPIGEMENYSA